MPNIDFWVGDPKESTYYQLYDTTATALKAVDLRLRVGGPAHFSLVHGDPLQDPSALWRVWLTR